jgi:hypothetical protein
MAMLTVLSVAPPSSAHCHIGPFHFAFIDCGG